MADSYGNSIKVTVFGTSHGEMIGASIDGLKAGIKIDYTSIKNALSLRAPNSVYSTSRVENDDFKIISGVFNDYTTGDILTLVIKNGNINSKDYDKNTLRPSHADYSAFLKYNGFQDYRGGGHFSGRLTAPLVAIGQICRDILKKEGVTIVSHIRQLKNIIDDEIDCTNKEQIEYLQSTPFSVVSKEKARQMEDEMTKCVINKDSIGGIIETKVIGVKGGIGEPFFDSIESKLSSLLFSVPAVKGVEFGKGFDFVNYYGSEVNDGYYFNNGIKTKTNNNGGINGGISNGNIISLSCVIKPTPSIGITQDSVKYNTLEEVKLNISGRHDPCIVARARIVIENMIAIGLLDLYAESAKNQWMK